MNRKLILYRVNRVFRCVLADDDLYGVAAGLGVAIDSVAVPLRYVAEPSVGEENISAAS